ncbi:hypothetical protein QAD02_020995 [Eretmocerus hayati]|uniref:Uncharacterized protein n=1 Tax=Eretmocerus hayati TaxID=131215 RepID=A0ACC2PP78_9HYME|nr:hypothetical protein QAD02_020995 [Eretmocerus hayati]
MSHEFVKLTEELYSIVAMTYNIHQFIRLADAIEKWGPLWAHAAFCFESANHDLLKVIKSAKGVIMQILRGLSIQRSIKLLELMVYPNCSEAVVKFCETIKPTEINVSMVSKSIKYVGRSMRVEAELVNQFTLPNRSLIYNKVIKDGSIFMSTARENVRSCNYYARLRNFSFVKIHGFTTDQNSALEVTVCQTIHVNSDDLVHHIKKIDSFERSLTLVDTAELDRICVMVPVGLDNYLIPVPNQLYY